MAGVPAGAGSSTPKEMITMLLRPEEMHLYSERERTRLAAERYALLEAARRLRRQRRAEHPPGRALQLIRRIRHSRILARAGLNRADR